VLTNLLTVPSTLVLGWEEEGGEDARAAVGRRRSPRFPAKWPAIACLLFVTVGVAYRYTGRRYEGAPLPQPVAGKANPGALDHMDSAPGHFRCVGVWFWML